jgi:hypothetical protein
VGNLIGYSYRKLGDYKFSQVWYERALKADPNHVLTWQYYGLWQIEEGNRDQTHENAERPGIAAGPFFFFLSAERLDLEVHTTHATHATHAAATRSHAGAGACVLLRDFGHHGFGGDQQRRNGSRVLDRHANHLGQVLMPLEIRLTYSPVCESKP